jgi:hypothetical protein
MSPFDMDGFCRYAEDAEFSGSVSVRDIARPQISIRLCFDYALLNAALRAMASNSEAEKARNG